MSFLPEKRKRNDGSPVEEISTGLFKKLKTKTGSYFGDIRFLLLFQKSHFLSLFIFYTAFSQKAVN